MFNSSNKSNPLLTKFFNGSPVWKVNFTKNATAFWDDYTASTSLHARNDRLLKFNLYWNNHQRLWVHHTGTFHTNLTLRDDEKRLSMPTTHRFLTPTTRFYLDWKTPTPSQSFVTNIIANQFFVQHHMHMRLDFIKFKLDAQHLTPRSATQSPAYLNSEYKKMWMRIHWNKGVKHPVYKTSQKFGKSLNFTGAQRRFFHKLVKYGSYMYEQVNNVELWLRPIRTRKQMRILKKRQAVRKKKKKRQLTKRLKSYLRRMRSKIRKPREVKNLNTVIFKKWVLKTQPLQYWKRSLIHRLHRNTHAAYKILQRPIKGVSPHLRKQLRDNYFTKQPQKRLKWLKQGSLTTPQMNKNQQPKPNSINRSQRLKNRKLLHRYRMDELYRINSKAKHICSLKKKARLIAASKAKPTLLKGLHKTTSLSKRIPVAKYKNLKHQTRPLRRYVTRSAKSIWTKLLACRTTNIYKQKWRRVIAAVQQLDEKNLTRKTLPIHGRNQVAPLKKLLQWKKHKVFYTSPMQKKMTQLLTAAHINQTPINNLAFLWFYHATRGFWMAASKRYKGEIAAKATLKKHPRRIYHQLTPSSPQSVLDIPNTNRIVGRLVRRLLTTQRSKKIANTYGPRSELLKNKIRKLRIKIMRAYYAWWFIRQPFAKPVKVGSMLWRTLRVARPALKKQLRLYKHLLNSALLKTTLAEQVVQHQFSNNERAKCQNGVISASLMLTAGRYGPRGKYTRTEQHRPNFTYGELPFSDLTLIDHTKLGVNLTTQPLGMFTAALQAYHDRKSAVYVRMMRLKRLAIEHKWWRVFYLSQREEYKKLRKKKLKSRMKTYPLESFEKSYCGFWEYDKTKVDFSYLFEDYISVTQPTLAFYPIKRRSYKKKKKIFLLKHVLKIAKPKNRLGKLYSIIKHNYFRWKRRRNRRNFTRGLIEFCIKELAMFPQNPTQKYKGLTHEKIGRDAVNEIIFRRRLESARSR